jgi:hypothetical protein
MTQEIPSPNLLVAIKILQGLGMKVKAGESFYPGTQESPYSPANLEGHEDS